MAEYWQPIHTRGQQTNGVWSTFNPDFTVDTVTLAQHQADVEAILTAATELSTQQDAYDDAVTARKANLSFIQRLNVRAPKLIQSNLPDGDSLLPEVDDVFNVPSTNQHNKLDRARLVISLWLRANAKRAAATPPLAAIQVGPTAVADPISSTNRCPERAKFSSPGQSAAPPWDQ